MILPPAAVLRNAIVTACIVCTIFGFSPVVTVDRRLRCIAAGNEMISMPKHASPVVCRQKSRLYSDPMSSLDSDNAESIPSPSDQESIPAVTEPEGPSYPIDLPSPLLLATSMLLAIVSIGSMFELSGGNPLLGVPASVALSVLGFPACIFLIYAAIRKGAAETEEDDKRFMNQ